METKTVTFIVDATIKYNKKKEDTKKIRAVRKAVKIGVNSIEGVEATRIQNKDNM